jgi:hypothetical protein
MLPVIICTCNLNCKFFIVTREDSDIFSQSLTVIKEQQITSKNKRDTQNGTWVILEILE